MVQQFNSIDVLAVNNLTAIHNAYASINHVSFETHNHIQNIKGEIVNVNIGLEKQASLAEKSITAVNTLNQSYSQLMSGLVGLGLVSDDLAGKMKNVNHILQIFAGLANAYKLMNMVAGKYLRTKVATAGTETFINVMRSPWKAAIVGGAIGAAAGVAGTLLLTSNNSNTTNNITIENTPEQVATGTQLYATIGGGSI